MLERQPGVAHDEERQPIGAVAHDEHAEFLETLERRNGIDDRLRSRADDEAGQPRHLEQVGRHVTRVRVHAADAAGRHDVDAQLRGDPQRGRHGRGAHPATRQRRREIAPRDFRNRQRAIAESLEVALAEPHAHLLALDRRPCGNGPFVTHGPVHGIRRLEVVRRRQALRQHAGLEGHDRTPLGARLAHLVADPDYRRYVTPWVLHRIPT